MRILVLRLPFLHKTGTLAQIHCLKYAPQAFFGNRTKRNGGGDGGRLP